MYLILWSTGESVDVEQGLAAASGRPYEDDTKLSKFLKDKYLKSQWHKKYWYGDGYCPLYTELVGYNVKYLHFLSFQSTKISQIDTAGEKKIIRNALKSH